MAWVANAGTAYRRGSFDNGWLILEAQMKYARMRRMAAVVSAGLCGALLLSIAGAQSWPSRPIKIVTTSPGSLGDTFGRLMAPKLGERLGQPVVVENRSAAGGGRITIAAVVQSAPDGYTFLIIPNTITSVPAVVKNPGFAPGDLTPVSFLGSGMMGLVVNASVEANSVAEFVALARANPGKMSYGSSGIGGVHHLTMEAFLQEKGLSMVHIPYPSASPLLSDITSGRTEALFYTLNVLIPHAKSGKVRVLAVVGDNRSPLLPEVPSTREAGVPTLDNPWVGLFAPGKTPNDIISRMHREVNSIVVGPEIRDRMAPLAITVTTLTQPEFVRFVQTDFERWKKVAATSNIVAD